MISDTTDAVYGCAACLKDVKTFYEIRITSLGNYCRLKRYKNKLQGVDDVKLNELKIVIANHEISAKCERDTKPQINKNCQDLLSSEDENELTKKDSNLFDVEESKQSLSKKGQFKCSDCDKSFTRRSYLKKHNRVHTGERPYKCTTCKKTFFTSSNLNQHKLIHTEEKCHKCDICHKTFTQKATLFRHKLCHSNMRPFQCAVCSNTFTRFGDLNRHMLSHTGQKPYKCHLCEYKCTKAVDLKKHIRSHTGEKPYSCKHCEKSFSQSSNLKDHNRRLHNSKDFN